MYAFFGGRGDVGIRFKFQEAFLPEVYMRGANWWRSLPPPHVICRSTVGLLRSGRIRPRHLQYQMHHRERFNFESGTISVPLIRFQTTSGCTLRAPQADSARQLLKSSLRECLKNRLATWVPEALSVDTLIVGRARWIPQEAELRWRRYVREAPCRRPIGTKRAIGQWAGR